MLRNPIITPSIPPDASPDERPGMERTLAGMEEYIRKYHTEFSLDDVYKAAQKSRATIYTITPGFKLLGLSSDEELAQYAAWQRKILLSWEPPGGIKKGRSQSQQIIYPGPENSGRICKEDAIRARPVGHYNWRMGKFSGRPVASRRNLFTHSLRHESSLHRRLLSDQQGTRWQTTKGKCRGARTSRIHGHGSQIISCA